MNKQTVALIALFVGWILAADIANATTYEDIAGQWCGDVTDYVFTPNTLTVKFHDNRPANEFKITKYTYTNDSVRIDWVNADGKESVTVFAEFGGNKMAQQGSGDKPRRAFHACSRSSALLSRRRGCLFAGGVTMGIPPLTSSTPRRRIRLRLAMRDQFTRPDITHFLATHALHSKAAAGKITA